MIIGQPIRILNDKESSVEIRIAENCGFCYGVKRAVNMAQKTSDQLERSYTLGPIIHNPQVVSNLEEHGVYAVDSLEEIPSGTVFELISFVIPTLPAILCNTRFIS